MTTEAPPEFVYGLAPVNDQDAQTKATHRLAAAIEQLTLAILDKSLPAPLQAVTAPVLASLPPVSPTPVQNPGAQIVAQCPVHHLPWKFIPAGTSKTTGNKYDAFYACPTRGCDQRPPR
jgi:hypothetical protein